MRFVHSTGRVVTFGGIIVALLFVAGACMSPQQASVQESIRVSGLVSVRGHEPFTRLVLTTDERNSYVLAFPSDGEEAEVRRLAPADFRVEGRLLSGTWEGRTWAQIEVQDWRAMGP